MEINFKYTISIIFIFSVVGYIYFTYKFLSVITREEYENLNYYFSIFNYINIINYVVFFYILFYNIFTKISIESKLYGIINNNFNMISSKSPTRSCLDPIGGTGGTGETYWTGGTHWTGETYFYFF